MDRIQEVIKRAREFARRPKDSPAGYRSHLTKEERQVFDHELLVERQRWSRENGRHYSNNAGKFYQIRSYCDKWR